MLTNDDDLYGDLDNTAVAKAASSQSSSQPSQHFAPKSVGAAQNNLLMSQPEIAKLQQQVKSLKTENDTLQRNVGILYRTAKSELERKDRTIEQLQNEIDSMRR